MMRQTLIIFSISTLVGMTGYAQEDDLAKKIQNPIANMVSLPFQNNLDFNDRNTNTLNIQPVTPFSLGSNVNLILRTIIPIVSAPTSPERTNGVGNIIMTGYFTPSKASKFIWGIGPALMFPSIKEELGSKKFSIAPSAISLFQDNGWTAGSIFQNFWSVAGDGADVNYFYSQIFIVKNIKNGWYVNTAPIITANWEAEENKWTIPIGAGVGKLIRAGKIPINCQVGYYRFLEHPTDATGQLRVQVVMILPKFY
ncbi:MAG: hypothetical protein JXR07_08760 [Reichenbachiella sp.]